MNEKNTFRGGEESFPLPLDHGTVLEKREGSNKNEIPVN